MNLLRSNINTFGSPIHYGWIVMAITFFTLFMSAGIRTAPTVVIVPLESYFGWSRTLISFALAVNLLLYGLCGPFSAALMELYGVRRVISFALLLLSIGAGLSTFMQAAWQMVVLWGLIIGLGTGSLSNVFGTVIATRWFARYRGVVLGIFSAATATGQLIFLPFFAKILETHTWHSIFFFISGATLFFMAVIGLLMRDKPEDVGLSPYGAAVAASTVPTVKGNPFFLVFSGLKRAVHVKDFWLLSGSFFVCGATTFGIIGTHFVPACLDHGFSSIAAAGLLSTAGIFNILGATGSGWLSDKFDNRRLLFWYYSLRGLALAFLPRGLAPDNALLFFFIIFYGLDWTATVPPTIRLATGIFGNQGSIIFGWLMVIHQIGAALAAFGSGALHTAHGSYLWSFITGVILCAIAAGLVLNIDGRSAPETENY